LKIIKVDIDPAQPFSKAQTQWVKKRIHTKFKKKNKNKLRKENTSRWKFPWTTTVKRAGNNSKNKHSDWKKAHERIAKVVLEK